MDIGTILLYLTFLFLILDVVLLLANDKIHNWLFYDHIVLYLASITIFASFLEFILNLVFQDTSYAYVTGYSSPQMDLPLRIASSWAGDVGSFYLWTILTFIGYIIFRLLFSKMLTQKIYQFASAIQGFNLLAFLTFVLMKNPFAKNKTAMQGIGLNPLLETFLYLIHPPIIFIAYAIFIIPFSIALAKLFAQQNDNEAPPELQRFTRLTMALGWLILGLGILIGGYWAYIELGWGGFWAWDPVETGSLIPWLFALVYFHGSPVFNSKKGNFGKDLITTFPYLSVLFATAVTRTGLLTSPHAFALSSSDTIIIVYLLILVAIIGIAILRLSSIKIGKEKQFSFDSKIKFFFSYDELKLAKRQDAALYISFFSFLLGTFAIMIGLIIPMFFGLLPAPFKQSFSVDKKYFNTIIGLFGFAALEAAFFTDFVFIKKDNNKILAIYTGILAGVTNVILNLPVVKYYLSKANLGILDNLLHILGTTSILANFILPILLLAFFILLITIYKFIVSKEMQKQVKMRKVSQTFLHIGIVIALLGALISTNTTNITDVQLEPNGSPAHVTTYNNVALKLIDQNYTQNGPNYALRLRTHVQLIDGNHVLGKGMLEYTSYTEFGVQVNVLIVSTLTNDYYITIMDFNNSNPNVITNIMYQIRVIPMIILLWFGATVVLAAMVLLVIISLKLFIFTFRKAWKNLRYQDQELNPIKQQ